MNRLKLSAQMYTLRDMAQNNLPATLKAVKKIGFTGVELAGFGNLASAAEVAKACRINKLAVSGSHVMLDALQGDLAKVVSDQKTLGNVNVVVPWLPEEQRKTVGDWLALAETLNNLGKKLDAEGLKLSYHNHAFEFDLFDGQTGMNLLLQHTDPALVGFEVDVYWVAHAGHDPVKFLLALGNRLRLVHLKDRAADDQFAPVGSGTLDFNVITQTAQNAGVEWGVVEQDDCYGQDPLAVLKAGFKYLSKLGYA